MALSAAVLQIGNSGWEAIKCLSFTVINHTLFARPDKCNGSLCSKRLSQQLVSGFFQLTRKQRLTEH